jgi:hypothetical protein
VFKSVVNLVQTCRQQLTQEVRERLSPIGEKGGKSFGWTNVMQERKIPGRNTLQGQARMEIEGRNILLQSSISTFNSILRPPCTFDIEITENYLGFIKSFESRMCNK